MRLNKYLTEAGLCSRREADKLIEAGKVTIDGRKAVLGEQVTDGQGVRVGKKVIGSRDEKVVLAFYKPVGVVCTEEKKVKDNIVKYLNYPVRVTYAGRLDKDSEGLMIMTNDGALIEKMMRSRYGHEKEYKVKVNKEITEDFLRALSGGIHLTDKEKSLDAVTRPCKVEKLGKYTFSIVLTQGINRQIRRMCEACGYKVERLIRVRVMNIRLEKLEAGKYRKLSEQELKELYERAEAGADEGADKSFK